jgi:2-oxoglutarate dehydrogenase E1 component
VVRNWRKPLIVLTPKSLLRHPRVTSRLDELSTGRFQRVLDDRRTSPETTRLVLLSTGKMYYDLLEARDQAHPDVAILCIDQLYPLRDEVLARALQLYAAETPVRWVQEDPENMGGWAYWKNRFCSRIVGRHPFTVVARSASASPATGSSTAHYREQEELIARAFKAPE